LASRIGGLKKNVSQGQAAGVCSDRMRLAPHVALGSMGRWYLKSKNTDKKKCSDFFKKWNSKYYQKAIVSQDWTENILFYLIFTKLNESYSTKQQWEAMQWKKELKYQDNVCFKWK